MAFNRDKEFSDTLYETALQAAQQQKPTYAGTYDDQLNDLFDKIQNREPFQYDVNADPLYQMHKDKYVQQGKLAMRDTMGKAAALTGGYGSSYGQQVGHQTYDAYLQGLSDTIPELYGLARQKYQDDGDNLKDLYAMAGQRSEREYGRYRDALGDWETALQRGLENERYEREVDRQQEKEDYERAKYADERDYSRRMTDEEIARQLERQQYDRDIYAEERDYNRARYEDERDYNRRMAGESTAYDRQQQAYGNLVALIKLSGYNPTDDELAAAGLTREAADAIRNNYLIANGLLDLGAAPDVGYGGGSGGGSAGSASGDNSSGGSGNKKTKTAGKVLSATGGVDDTTYRGIMQTISYSKNPEEAINGIDPAIFNKLSDKQKDAIAKKVGLR